MQGFDKVSQGSTGGKLVHCTHNRSTSASSRAVRCRVEHSGLKARSLGLDPSTAPSQVRQRLQVSALRFKVPHRGRAAGWTARSRPGTSPPRRRVPFAAPPGSGSAPPRCRTSRSATHQKTLVDVWHVFLRHACCRCAGCWKHVGSSLTVCAVLQRSGRSRRRYLV